MESTLGGGATLKRAIPKAGRDDPCACGSGRKFKQCCEGKASTAEQYEVGGVTISEATAHPELVLTRERIWEMRSYELYALDPKRLIPPLAGEVAIQLAVFGEISRSIEMLKAAGPDSLSLNALDAIAFEFFLARELREHLRRPNDNLKVEHDERNRALRDLRAAQDQLRRASREKHENSATENAANREPDTENSSSTDVEWVTQALRIPEYGTAFREAVRNHPRQASAAALAAVGRLAGGDPSIWKTVRVLKLRPGTLRVRVAGDYRLLFEIGSGDTLRLVDFILRRDLDRWLAGGGR